MLEEVCRSLGSPPPMFFFVGGSPCKLKAKTLSGSVLWHVPPHSHNHNNKRRKERKKFLVPTLPRIGVQFSVSFYLSAKKLEQNIQSQRCVRSQLYLRKQSYTHLLGRRSYWTQFSGTYFWVESSIGLCCQCLLIQESRLRASAISRCENQKQNGFSGSFPLLVCFIASSWPHCSSHVKGLLQMTP